ncbi:MAG TPA: long-chain fatty acid--CoA ligase [Actinomycetota bacterium]|nr:long-chain fatty acid--CoA ligase [Actinomycetota bacterium]
MRSLADLVTGSADRRPDTVALIADDRSLTYGQLEDRVRRVAGALAGIGVTKGDRVAVLFGTVPEFVEVLHGAWRLGAVVAPLNVMLTPDELGYVLADSEASVVVTDRAFLPSVLAVRDRLADLHHVVVARGRSPRRTESYEKLLARAPDPPPVTVDRDDLALLAYTAGTTANPKGAMLTQGNLLANLDQMSQVPALHEAESDVVLLALPLFHIYALNVVLGITLREGATAVLVERFDPVRTLELVERHRVTVLFGAPPMFAAWLQAAEHREFDLSSVRLAVSGAAALPAEVLAAFRDRFGITIWEGYGLTETAPALTTTALGSEGRPDSIGLVLPGVEVRLVDDHGRDVDEGDPGEIVVRGPNVFSGYWRKPEETESAFRDGWFRTGDVAFRDDDGYLHIVDRTKDLVIVSGFNVYPREVEEAIASHPAVAECAVIGVPDERTGEAVKAFVVPAAGSSLTEEDVLAQCTDRLARFKWPREIEIVRELPKHVTGKILRRRLRDAGS